MMERTPADDPRTSLLERRRRLEAELAELTTPPEPGATVGFGKRVGDGTTEAVERISTTLTARSIAASIDEIDDALDRMSSGGYGICVDCATPIPAERLEARPAATRCVSCASKS